MIEGLFLFLPYYRHIVLLNQYRPVLNRSASAKRLLISALGSFPDRVYRRKSSTICSASHIPSLICVSNLDPRRPPGSCPRRCLSASPSPTLKVKLTNASNWY